MGFFDRIKEKANQIKEENRNFGSTMKRMNNRSAFYGNVNRGIKDGDFWNGSYVNIENGHGVIYGSNQDDYTFNPGDVKEFKLIGDGPSISVGNEHVPSLRYAVQFADGKLAQFDLIVTKIEAFRNICGC